MGSVRELLVVGAQFAEAVTSIKDPRDLENFPWIVNTTHNDPLHRTFLRLSDGERRDIRAHATCMMDAAPAIRQAIIGGASFTVLPDFLVAADIAAGRILHVLPEWGLRTGGIYAVFPPARYRAPKVRAFVDVLLAFEKSRQRRPQTV